MDAMTRIAEILTLMVIEAAYALSAIGFVLACALLVGGV